MKYICSANHIWDTENLHDKISLCDEPILCPMEISYDKLHGGSKYCRRKLKELDLVVDYEYEMMYKRIINGNHKWFKEYKWTESKGKEIINKNIIRSLLLGGNKVRCAGVRTSIMNVRDYIIFWEKS